MDDRFYKQDFSVAGGRGKTPCLRQTARKMAVALIETGNPYGCAVRREVGCTWNGGNPVYQTDRAEYAVGSKKSVPEGAVRVEGTKLWVFKCRDNE